MLRTNTKKARENIRRYIMDNFTPEGYTDTPPETWPEIARFILETFADEKRYSTRYYGRYMIADWNVFIDWCQGLPSILDTCYYYNRSAVDDLGSILEETEEEKARFTEAQAEERLTILIYNELMRGAEQQ